MVILLGDLMMGDQRNGQRKMPPAKGLQFLTWSEVEQIDRHVQEVCAAGYGVVKITVENGLPRFVSTTRSEVLKPAGV